MSLNVYPAPSGQVWQPLGKEELEGILYVATWYTQEDERVCPVCGNLDGYTWVSEYDQPLPDILFHPIHGDAWDLRAERSLTHVTHPWLKGECRCYIDVVPMILVEGKPVRIDEAESRVHSLNQSMIGIQRDIVAAERLALGAATGDLSATSTFWMGQRLVRRYAPRISDVGQMTLQPAYYGLMKGGGVPLVGGLGRTLAMMSPLIEPALIAIAVALPIIRELEQMVDEAQRPARISEAFRERVSARERERAWNRYRTPSQLASGGGGAR